MLQQEASDRTTSYTCDQRLLSITEKPLPDMSDYCARLMDTPEGSIQLLATLHSLHNTEALPPWPQLYPSLCSHVRGMIWRVTLAWRPSAEHSTEPRMLLDAAELLWGLGTTPTTRQDLMSSGVLTRVLVALQQVRGGAGGSRRQALEGVYRAWGE
jgi:hypothetical protein